MSAASRRPEVWAAVPTPVARDGAVRVDLLAGLIRDLGAAGCDGVVPFGTTGEGPSFDRTERQSALEALVAAGIAPERMIVGTGCPALGETVALTRHAAGLGCAGALVLPPYFFRDATSDGLFAYVAALAERTADTRIPLWLYHIPQVAGIGFPVGTVRRLADAFPDRIAGVKDSTGDWTNTSALLAAAPALRILVGHEPHLPRAVAAGGGGTICGLVNIAPALIRALADAPDPRLQARAEALVAAISDGPFVALLKSVLATRSGERDWLNVRAPLVPEADGAALTRRIDAILAADTLDTETASAHR